MNTLEAFSRLKCERLITNYMYAEARYGESVTRVQVNNLKHRQRRETVQIEDGVKEFSSGRLTSICHFKAAG